MSAALDLSFEVITPHENPSYTGGCSCERSDCCTRVCTRGGANDDEASLEAWDKYLEVNQGVLQY